MSILSFLLNRLKSIYYTIILICCNKQIYLIRLDIHLMSQNNKLSKIQKERIRKWIKKNE